MAHIGIIRGFGEGYVATGYIIKLIKAIKRRYRTKLTYEEIKLGNAIEYGDKLKSSDISLMRECSFIFSGDFTSPFNPLEYSVDDISIALGNNAEYGYVVGLGEKSDVDIQIASYFDGGAKLREHAETQDGCVETRVCSTYTAMNVVKSVTRSSEKRRRSIAYVKLGENAFCDKMFRYHFENTVFPLSNFRFTVYSTENLISEMIEAPMHIDTIFASRTLIDMAFGLYRVKFGKNVTFFRKYTGGKTIYACCAREGNSHCGKSVPSIADYIMAFSVALNNELNLEKESYYLKLAVSDAINKNVSTVDGDKFINAVIEYLEKPVETKFRKKTSGKNYITKIKS